MICSKATQYQVSRIPVREALRQLDAEGLISIVPNRGAIVPALSPGDIEELFSIRALLEPEVLKLSIPHLSEDDFSGAAAVLRKYVGELRRDEHHQMLQLCRQRDVPAACNLLREHIRYAGESLKRVLEQTRTENQGDAVNGGRKKRN